MRIKPNDEDNLLVPAGFVRVAFGLLVMVGGVFIAALSARSWGEYLGLLMFLCSPCIMLTRPNRKDKGNI